MTANPQRLIASRLTPNGERCPDCGDPVPMRRKGQRLRRCGPCNLALQRQRHRAYDAAHRPYRRRGRTCCPPYEAWIAWALGPGCWAVARDPADPDAVVLPAYGACSCGEAGCVHLVVACLAQQAEGGGD